MACLMVQNSNYSWNNSCVRHIYVGLVGWLRCTMVERPSVTSELSLSYA